MMNPSHCSNNSLFLGDLSKFCTEMELENLFSCCGQILDVKIKRNNNTGKTLSYGFVTFANEEIAARAMKTMDGTMFYGRKLRIRWAQYNARSHPINEQVINSVYVRFVSPKLDVYITEEDLHNVFDQFGSVVDVSIKESAIDKRTNRQSGYGFVHFSCDKAGVECAFQAVSALDNATVNGVTYYVELSKNLLKQFNEMHGNNGVGMGTSPMGGSGVSPTAAGGAAYHAPHHARVPSYGSMAYGGGVGGAGAGAGGRPPATAAFDNNAAAAAHYMAPPPHMQAPPQYMHPHAHEYYETDSYFPPAAPPATAAAAPGGGVPLGYSPKASGYGSAGPSVPSLNLAPRPLRPQHIRDSSLGSMDPTAFGGQLSVRSYSGSTSPLPPHAVSPVNSSHGSLTPPHSLAGGGGSVRSGWSHGGVGNGGSNNTSMHSMHEFGVSPPRSGEEAFLLLQQQQSQMLQAQQLGLGAIRPVVPRLQINTAAAAPVGAPNVNNDYGMASMHHTPPMQGHKMPFTPSQVGGRQLQQPQQQQPVPQFAELLAQELRPYEMQQQQQQVQHMSYQHLFPVSSTSRSPLNRSVGSATSAAAAAGGIGVSGGFEDDPERLMGPRSRAGTLTVSPLNLNNKSPMAASAGYSSMVQKSFTMQQQQQMMQQQEARHRRTLTGEVHDVDSLTFEGLTMTPNGLGSFLELHGDRHGASLSPPPSLLGGLGTTSRSTDSNGSSGSGVTPTSSGGNSASGVPSLLFDANILNGVTGGGALSTTGNVTSSEEKINSDGLVSQAIKLLSPPGTPRDYAVLLGVNFL